MDQVTHGVRSILSIANVYDALQGLLGASRLRTRFIEEFVAPFPGARVLDVGCGTGRIVEYLPADVEYVGFDLNCNYISHARKKYGTRATFFCDRVSEATVGQVGNFDFVLAIGILHHLNDHEAEILFAMASDCLKRGGSLVTFDNVYVENQSAIARYIISKDRGQHVRTPEQYSALAETSFDNVRKRIVHDLLRIPYTHFIMKCLKLESPLHQRIH